MQRNLLLHTKRIPHHSLSKNSLLKDQRKFITNSILPLLCPNGSVLHLYQNKFAELNFQIKQRIVNQPLKHYLEFSTAIQDRFVCSFVYLSCSEFLF